MSRYYEKQWQAFNKIFSDDISDALVPQPEPEPVEEENMYTRRRRRALYHTKFSYKESCEAAIIIQKYVRRMIIRTMLVYPLDVTLK